jgi:hypothetical protein
MAIDTIDRVVAGLIETVGPAHASSLRTVRHGVEEQVRAAAITTGAAATVDLGAQPDWWRTIGYSRPLAAIAGGALGYWAASALDLVDPLPLAIALVFASMIWLAVGAFVSASGRRWGALVVTRQREQLAGAAGRELDRRIGRPLRDALRVRASVGAALTEFEMVRSALGSIDDSIRSVPAPHYGRLT